MVPWNRSRSLTNGHLWLIVLTTLTLTCLACMAPAAAEGPASAARQSAFTTAPPSPQPTQDLDLEKKDLEVEKLRQETSLEGRFRPYIPLLSVVAALIAGSFGIFKYIRDNRRDYMLRVEQDIAANIEHIVEFPKDGNHLNALVTTALDNLSWLISQTSSPDRHQARITEAIVTAVMDDIDFDDPKQARLEILCQERWKDYNQRLISDQRIRTFILYRYHRALVNLHSIDKNYFSKIKMSADGSFLVEEYTEEKNYRHFLTLVSGFRSHFKLIESDTIRNQAIQDFATALDNKILAEQLFNPSPDADHDEQTSSTDPNDKPI